MGTHKILLRMGAVFLDCDLFLLYNNKRKFTSA